METQLQAWPAGALRRSMLALQPALLQPPAAAGPSIVAVLIAADDPPGQGPWQRTRYMAIGANMYMLQA